jgi:hypothetical protein
MRKKYGEGGKEAAAGFEHVDRVAAAAAAGSK